jgi:ATP phosphoribosyltransferase regulatory subunit
LREGAAQDELYRFVDRDGELLALRADFTPLLARLLAPRLAALETPLRLFYRGDVVRYQEPHPGRLREYYQIGAELLGVGSREADEEVLRLFLELLAASETRGVVVVLGFAGALDRLLLEAAEGQSLAAAVRRRERRAARLASPSLLEVVEHGAPADPMALGGNEAERLGELQRLAASLAKRYPATRLVVDLAEFATATLDRRLSRSDVGSYYDGVIYRAYVGGAAMAVGQGGRYDRLFRRYGAEVPAVGFSLGVDGLLEAQEVAQ